MEEEATDLHRRGAWTPLSFGVFLLEVVSEKLPWDIYKEHLENCNQSLESYAEKNVDKSKIAPECWKIFVDIIDITERCLQAEGRERPDMGEVEVELEHALQFQEEADAKNFGSENSDRI
ncbi:hypothetical protein PIB30_001449 [Stylosanthes scabra]|uniref:Uncharacterized protein n=1 Tax=Stylosanthes scabra TaxID=79078 RepID=A0ABU6Q2F1_9FABA|nr:hypothetical protein [Stylosanthes scabra]